MCCSDRPCLVRNLLMVLTAGAAALLLTGCPPGGEALRVGALFSETGEMGEVGRSIKAGLEIGLTDANDYLAAINADFRLVIDGENTGGDAGTAAERAEVLRQRGMDVLIGPQFDAAADALLPWADEHDVLLLSPSSTTPSLSIEEDNLLRMVADDTHQVAAAGYSFLLNGINMVAPLYRDDLYGAGVADALAAYFSEEKQLSVLDGVSYAPDTADFTATLDALDAAVADAQAASPGFAVAVYVAAFDEIVDILLAAESYPRLMAVRWYASGAVAQSQPLQANPDAAAIASDVGLTAVAPGGFGSGSAAVRQAIADRLGETPNEYALYAYDAVQVLASAYVELGKDADMTDIKGVLPLICEEYLGVTGWALLNGNGDRAVGNYFTWMLQPDEEDALVWENMGVITAK